MVSIKLYSKYVLVSEALGRWSVRFKFHPTVTIDTRPSNRLATICDKTFATIWFNFAKTVDTTDKPPCKLHLLRNCSVYDVLENEMLLHYILRLVFDAAVWLCEIWSSWNGKFRSLPSLLETINLVVTKDIRHYTGQLYMQAANATNSVWF